MKYRWLIAVIVVSIFALPLHSQDNPAFTNISTNIIKKNLPAPSYSRLKVTALSFLNIFPYLLYDNLTSWSHELQRVDYLSYTMPATVCLGFGYFGEWNKTLLWTGVDSAALLLAYYTRAQGLWAYFGWISGHHLPMLLQYEIYKNARLKVSSSQYSQPFVPVKMKDAMLAPFRFDYLRDPWVSIGLTCAFMGNLVGRLLSASPAAPSDPFEFNQVSYPRPEGTLLYAASQYYTSYWAGVAEEALFRGYLLPEMTEYMHPLLAIFLNSFLFVMVHYENNGQPANFANFLIHSSYSMLPTALLFNYLSYKENYDFRKAAFVHCWYDILMETLLYFYDLGQSSGQTAEFNPHISLAFPF